ncbi:MAG: hypothetical protein R6V31_11830 [Halohasta sp.]
MRYRICKWKRVDAEDLRFEFTLSSGSYATALMREYLKIGPLEL